METAFKLGDRSEYFYIPGMCCMCTYWCFFTGTLFSSTFLFCFMFFRSFIQPCIGLVYHSSSSKLGHMHISNTLHFIKYLIGQVPSCQVLRLVPCSVKQVLWPKIEVYCQPNDWWHVTSGYFELLREHHQPTIVQDIMWLWLGVWTDSSAFGIPSWPCQLLA